MNDIPVRRLFTRPTRGRQWRTRRTGVNVILSGAVFARVEGTVIDDEATGP